jgi:hypothetical protein
MTNDDSLVEPVRLAIQAQEDIKRELIEEILALERDARPQRTTLKQVQFYASTLRHTLSEKSSILEEISNLRNTIIPDLERQTERAIHRQQNLQSRIMSLQMSRSPAVLRDVSKPDKAQAAVAAFLESLQKEISDLEASENTVKDSTAKAKAELRVLQDQVLNYQRERATKALAEELADEKRVNQGRFIRSGRKRSMTIQQSQPRVVRNRGMSLRIIKTPFSTVDGDGIANDS